MIFNELRLGNIVNTPYGVQKVISVEQGRVTIKRSGAALTREVLNPSGVPINEEWLQKAGLTNKPGTGIWTRKIKSNGLKSISIHKNADSTWAVGIVDFKGSPEALVLIIDFVHQLQNFFYMFTKEEVL